MSDFSANWPALRQTVQSVAKTIVANHGVGKLRSDPLVSHVVKWMEEQGIVEGDHISPSLITLKTCFSKPRPCCDCDSRLGIRHALQASGWRECDTAWDASVEGRRFNPGAPLEYFVLLKHHLPCTEAYEAAYGLKHSQAKGYYEALLSFFSNKPEASQAGAN